MKSTEVQKNRLEQGLLEVIDFYRGIILDAVEQNFGGDDDWPFLRKRLLKALGDRGLSGRITEIIRSEFKS